MHSIISNFQMSDELKGVKITLKRVDKDDIHTINNICEALFTGTTTERIKKTMSYFAESPADLQSVIKTLNQCFDKNGFNYFIFKGDEVVGQLYGFPLGSCNNKTPISMWGWIGDKHLRQGYMKEAIKMVEDEHFSKSSDPLEMYVRSDLIIDSFAKTVKFQTQDKSQMRSYFRLREDWLSEQQPQVIMHHDDMRDDLVQDVNVNER